MSCCFWKKQASPPEEVKNMDYAQQERKLRETVGASDFQALSVQPGEYRGQAALDKMQKYYLSEPFVTEIYTQQRESDERRSWLQQREGSPFFLRTLPMKIQESERKQSSFRTCSTALREGSVPEGVRATAQFSLPGELAGEQLHDLNLRMAAIFAEKTDNIELFSLKLGFDRSEGPKLFFKTWASILGGENQCFTVEMRPAVESNYPVLGIPSKTLRVNQQGLIAAMQNESDPLLSCQQSQEPRRGRARASSVGDYLKKQFLTLFGKGESEERQTFESFDGGLRGYNFDNKVF